MDSVYYINMDSGEVSQDYIDRCIWENEESNVLVFNEDTYTANVVGDVSDTYFRDFCTDEILGLADACWSIVHGFPVAAFDWDSGIAIAQFNFTDDVKPDITRHFRNLEIDLETDDPELASVWADLGYAVEAMDPRTGEILEIANEDKLIPIPADGTPVSCPDPEPEEEYFYFHNDDTGDSTPDINEAMGWYRDGFSVSCRGFSSGLVCRMM